jgi:hypothetical protein
VQKSTILQFVFDKSFLNLLKPRGVNTAKADRTMTAQREKSIICKKLRLTALHAGIVLTPPLACNNEDESDEMFINSYDIFLMTGEFAEENMFRYSDETDRVHDEQCGQTFENDPSDNQDNDDESEADPDEEEEVDDWVLLCRINQDYGEAGNRLSDNEAVDWFETVRAVPRDLLRESPGWIYSQRKEAEEHG